MSEQYTKSDDGDLLGPMGWGPQDREMHPDNILVFESESIYMAQNDSPIAWTERPAREVPDSLKHRLEEVHQKHGMSYNEGSIDLRLLTEVAFGSLYMWLAQIIGSCVASGGIKCWTLSALYQILVLGQPEEALGHMRLGVDTIVPYGPMSYGLGRRRGNMRRGDGSYCSIQIASFMKDGVLDCNTPQLHRITGTDDNNFPEPQSAKLYREFGSWGHLDDLKPYLDYRVLESVEVKDASQSVELLRAGKPHMICSGWGFGPTSKKVNSFTVYKRSGSWSHNMTICGVLVGEDGNLYIIVLNSWGPRAHRDGEFFIIPIELYAKWLKSASCIAIGDIDLPDSAPRMSL